MLRFWWGVLLLTVAAAALGWWVVAQRPPVFVAQADLLLTDPAASSVFAEAVRVDEPRRLRNEVARANSSAVAQRAAEIVGGVSLDDVLARASASAAADLDLIRVRARARLPQDAAALANAVTEAYQQIVGEEVAAQAAAAVGQLTPYIDGLRARIAELDARLDAIRATAEAEVRALPPPDPLDPPISIFEELERRLASNPLVGSLTSDRSSAQGQLEALETRTQQIAVDAALLGSGVDFVDPATPPGRAAEPDPLFGAAAAGLVGLVLSAALALWWARRPQRVLTPEDAAIVVDAPLLGTVPRWSVRRHGHDPARREVQSVLAEGFQLVVANLGIRAGQLGARVLLVTSARPGDGKSLLALNIAIAAARDGRRVVLIDADVRSSELTRQLDAPAGGGLRRLADADVAVDEVLHRVPIPWERHLLFASAGTGILDPASYFRTAGFRRAVTRVSVDADLVIIDAPPLGAVADATAIGDLADGVILVVRRRTALRTLVKACDRIAFMDRPLVGFVLNRAHESLELYRPRPRYQGEPKRPRNLPAAEEQPGDPVAVAAQPAAGDPPDDSADHA